MNRELTITPSDAATGQRILHLNGPIVVETLFKFRDTVNQETSATVVLDFSQVPYIDSAGLGSMVSAFVRYKDSGRSLTLAALNEKCRALLKMTNLDSTFKTFPTVEEALNSLR